MGRVWVGNGSFSFSRNVIDSIDGLKNPVDGATAEIVQLGNGQITGRLSRATIGDVSFSKGAFSLPIRASGVLSQTRLTVGVILECSSPLKARQGIGHSGDILVHPPGFDHQCIFTGGASFAGLCIDTIDMAMIFGREGPLADPAFWCKPFKYSPLDLRSARGLERCLNLVFARLARQKSLPATTGDYLKMSVVEAFAAPVIGASITAESPSITSAIKIVSEVERYVDARSFRPVHISELCSYLKISRRTLHRCFEDALGIGPGAFLRQKRLCSVHSTLRRLDTRTANVTQVATDFGFLELGRFAHQYRQLFGEYPNETLRR
jgi:AraC-like DNA-binding protein